jgi:hypothetical protein
MKFITVKFHISLYFAMDLIGVYEKIRHNTVNIAAGILTIFLVSTIVILSSPYQMSIVSAQKTIDAVNTNDDGNANNSTSAALPTNTAVQKNATAESIAKATGTNSTGITGFSSSSPMRSMINPVFKMTRNPLANLTNPLNSTGK